ncbi:MAG TPA: hypothetical protein VGR30_07875 [Candidatus Binatia bacterium]|jgi:hypothetical protein|nr:hypothetical protein [Candidatus Binatia bacterium]
MSRERTVQTTLGDLIVALAEEAAPYAHDEREVNLLVSYLLVDLLSRSPSALTWH